jgi:hypothetical protein
MMNEDLSWSGKCESVEYLQNTLISMIFDFF